MLSTYDKLKCILSSIYIPPNSSALSYVKRDFIDQLQWAYPGYQFIICGDYNLPNAKRNCINGDFSVNSLSNSNGEIVRECLNYLDICQFNLLPNNHGTFLDFG